MSSCIGFCLPPFFLWRQHTALQRSHFNHFRMHRDGCRCFSGYLVKCLLWRCNLYIYPSFKCASFRIEFTFLIFRKGKVTEKALLKFLSRFFFPKEREYLCILTPICHSFNTLSSCNFCLIADASLHLISQVHGEQYFCPTAENSSSHGLYLF